MTTTVLDADPLDPPGVVLQACEPRQLARERAFGDISTTFHGTFTYSLLAVLLSDGSHTKTYTEICEEVVRLMPSLDGVPLQTPGVRGERADCPLWYGFGQNDRCETTQAVAFDGVGAPTSA